MIDIASDRECYIWQEVSHVGLVASEHNIADGLKKEHPNNSLGKLVNSGYDHKHVKKCVHRTLPHSVTGKVVVWNNLWSGDASVYPVTECVRTRVFWYYKGPDSTKVGLALRTVSSYRVRGLCQNAAPPCENVWLHGPRTGSDGRSWTWPLTL